MLDEYNKLASNSVITERAREMGQERRHNTLSFVCNGQRPSGMDSGFLGQSTIIACFRMASRKEIRVLKVRFAVLEKIPDDVFLTLPEGECVIAAMQTTGNAGAAETANALSPQVGTTDWEDALSQKVVFLSNAHSQSAELTLNPKDLGPLQVVLQVADNHAHALFVSQHQSVREAVEAALPKLREAMESNGIGLGSASVSDGFARQGSQQQNADSGRSGGRSSGASGSFGGGTDPIDTTVSVPTRRTIGLVDTFA